MTRTTRITLTASGLAAACICVACATARPWSRPDPAAASQGARMEAPEAPAERDTSPTRRPASAAAPASPEGATRVVDTMEGRVSYYADSLAGRSTASGEPYDPHALTAASPELPFGTLVRVTRPDTGASVVVRINDRGPNGGRGRILDLSRAAAEALDMIRLGVASVRAEVLAPAE